VQLGKDSVLLRTLVSILVHVHANQHCP